MQRRSLVVGAGFFAFMAVACGLSFAAGAKPAAGKPAAHGGDQKAVLERGLYLTTVMGCNDCHTPGSFYGAPDFDRKLSGSDMGWKGPWGITFAKNLTPDMETGLGYWSEAEIIKAFRSGVRNDGSPVLPPMPWQNFAALTDADAHAIAVYLMSLPPVKHKPPGSVPPGKEYAGAFVEFPPPTPWDGPRAAAGQ